MSEEQQDQKQEDPKVEELMLLKERADLMGIKYSPNIGIAKLKEKIEAKKANPTGYEDEEYDTIVTAEQIAESAVIPALQTPTPAQLKAARKNKALKLVRIRVTCMNPIKSNMKGDIFTAGNSEIGTVTKYVPFNAEQGWHVPQIILDMIKSKKYSTFYEVKQGNRTIKRRRLVPEYAIEIMPSLTPKELQELKQRQLMAQGQ